MHRLTKVWVHSVAAACCAALAACGGVQVKPDLPLPKALVVPLSARTGLILDDELRNFKHDETRYGANWKVDLGPGHVRLFESVFGASFANSQSFKSLEEARAATGLQALFTPHIEQYSFATARDTSGGYWAVTIRYRIGVQTPAGAEADSLTLTGYGSAVAKGGSDKSLSQATISAMRDAAAKLLVQLPRQPVVLQMRDGQAVKASDAGGVVAEQIEAVPIEP
jgi:hypothetical protein